MSYKSQATASLITDKLKLVFADARDAGFDTDGLPLIRVGAGTAGSQSALVKVKDLPVITKDSLGLAQETFCPEVIQVVLEESTIANVALLTLANLGQLVSVLMGVGTSKVELYMSANTNTVGPEDLIVGNLKAEIWGDLKYRQLNGQ